ncbi:hypothetical protein IAQ61_000716 [Plenodomus lingam]|uniref:Uncharacterized protein n=1 Tax=Leptosphaeria maculans (strain JN3 / isolate v23.1.3 / race Av1-4-5-6-7-8) TaxID=985895 RepID=E5A6B5_LEPMJ|nr:predicted protein [Plenodomus lingam JN3]KAH9880425.1 hypothetical protein IAQ61_000716 [Plenodomus lingam]CBX99160.1 predicted protein [Plenodomus lingam JN3]
MKPIEKINWLTVAVRNLVLRFTSRLGNCCRSNRKKESLLPITYNHEPRPAFSDRHLAHLRDWQKPPISSGGILPLRLGQPKAQYPPHPPMINLQIPALAVPENSHQPQRPYHKITWQQFQDRKRDRDPMADEYHRRVRENWQPSKPLNYAYWKQYGEEMEARKTVWEKVKDKWFKRFPSKEREIEFF